MNSQTEREEIRQETHELEDTRQDELEGEESEWIDQNA